MTKQEQALQLRLAADILETGHPWESLPSPEAEWARHKLDPTNRPLTFTHEGKEWARHKPGDPMPCDGGRKVHFMMARDDSRLANKGIEEAGNLRWGKSEPGESDIIGWRYAEPSMKTVDLGPEDVPPGSVFRCNLWSNSKCWLTARSVRDNGVELTNDFGWATWHNLAEGFQINRPANRDADGNPTAWEPCSKQIPA